MYTKNAKLRNDDKFGELVAETADVQWDIVMFSETKNNHGIIELHGGNFRHICFRSGTATFAAGVAILLHERHDRHVAETKSFPAESCMWISRSEAGNYDQLHLMHLMLAIVMMISTLSSTSACSGSWSLQTRKANHPWWRFQVATSGREPWGPNRCSGERFWTYDWQ